MSVSNKELVKLRIQTATESSPIAVFRTDNPGLFNAVFANTVITQWEIDKNCALCVGVFYGSAGEAEFSRSVS